MTFASAQDNVSKTSESIVYPMVRPSLEYCYAFDMCAAEVHSIAGEVAVLVSNPFYYSELAARLTDVTPAPDFFPLYGSSGKISLASASTAYRSAIWAAPDGENAAETMYLLNGAIQRKGVLLVVSPGLLSRFSRSQDEALTNSSAASGHLGSLRTRRLLKHGGFQIDAEFGLHGVVSIFWGYLSILASKIGRDDLADSFHFRMRETYLVTGPQAHASTLVIYKCHSTDPL